MSNYNWVIPKYLAVGGHPYKFEDLNNLLNLYNVKVIVNLIEDFEFNKFNLFDYVNYVKNKDIIYISFPIKDQSMKSSLEMEPLILNLINILVNLINSDGGCLYVHCRGGHGRSMSVVTMILGKLLKYYYNFHSDAYQTFTQLIPDLPTLDFTSDYSKTIICYLKMMKLNRDYKPKFPTISSRKQRNVIRNILGIYGV